MSWPSVVDYSAAVQNPASNLADPALARGRPAPGLMGMPLSYAGNFACVFKIVEPGGRAWAAKCFTRKVSDTQMRYARISEHLARHPSGFAVAFQYQQQGIRVGGEWYPIVKMDWVEGQRLNDLLAEHADNAALVGELAAQWLRLAGVLREAGVAHGDLHHGNILASTTGAASLRLIDYDGMWVPALDGSPPDEAGQPNYQHPARQRQGAYNRDMDRFSQLVIYTALRCVAVGGKRLWDRFDDRENLLFRASDFHQPAHSRLWPVLLALPDAEAAALAGHLLLASQGPLEEVAPLDHVVARGRVVPLSPTQDSVVKRILAGARPGGAGWWADVGTPRRRTPLPTTGTPASRPAVPRKTPGADPGAPAPRRSQQHRASRGKWPRRLAAVVGATLLFAAGVAVWAVASTKDAGNDSARADPAPPPPAQEKQHFGRLTLALEQEKPRYGDPITFTITIDGPGRDVGLRDLQGGLSYYLDGKRLRTVEDRVGMTPDQKIQVGRQLRAGQRYRFHARFAGNHRFHPVETDPVSFEVEFARLGAFQVVVTKPSDRPGAVGLELDLKFDRTPTLEDADWEHFRFFRLPEEGGSEEDASVPVRPIPDRPGRFRVSGPVAAGKARIGARYAGGDRYGVQGGLPTQVIDVPGFPVVFRFPNRANAHGSAEPDATNRPHTGGTLRVRVAGTEGGEPLAHPAGAVHATLDGKRLAPATLRDGVAELRLRATDLAVTLDLTRQLTLRYEPGQGTFHRACERTFPIRVAAERVIDSFNTARKATPLEGVYFAELTRSGTMPLGLPGADRYALRLEAPAPSRDSAHEFYAHDSLSPRELAIAWRYSKGELMDPTLQPPTPLRFSLNEPAGQPGKAGERIGYSLSWELVDFRPHVLTRDVVRQKKLTRLFSEACEKPHLLRACRIAVVWYKGESPHRNDPVVLRLLLPPPPAESQEPPQSAKGPPR